MFSLKKGMFLGKQKSKNEQAPQGYIQTCLPCIFSMHAAEHLVEGEIKKLDNVGANITKSNAKAHYYLDVPCIAFRRLLRYSKLRAGVL